MSLDLDVSELYDLARDLGKAGEAKRAESVRAVQVIAADTQRAAKAAAPRDRPWLSRSGIRRKTWAGRDGVHVDVFTTPDPDHGGDEARRNVGFYVEYGTSDTAPRPFLGPQMPGAAQRLVEELAEVLDPFRRFSTTQVPDD